MLVATLYRRDLITGELIHVVKHVALLSGDATFIHTQATEAGKRNDADAYRICMGVHFLALKPISLMHDIKADK